MRKSFIVVTLLINGTCFAQEKPTQPTPELRALNERVNKEIMSGLQCSTYNYVLEDRVKAAEAEVKRLSEKYEPKKEESLK